MAYQARRNKRYEEDFELVDENGAVQHTLHVSLDADDMVAKINRKYTALVRALADVQEIKREEASNEQLGDAVEKLGRAEMDMFEAVFGAEGAKTIQQFYTDRYIEMAKEVIPFITGVVIPRLAEIKTENKKALLGQYNRVKKRRRFW
jgi:hypothetical protein|nr:MAG TPA: hypothetical protein [Caudoviricetes sp.]